MLSVKAAGLKVTPKELCDSFMEKIAAGKPKDAFELLKPHFPIEELNLNNLLVQAEGHIPTFKEKYGEMLGFELVKKQEAKELFMELTYILKFEISAVRWVFMFYKPKKSWIVNMIHYDEKQDEIF
jgi:hypothetical protein